jgi:hypothetical protein
VASPAAVIVAATGHQDAVRARAGVQGDVLTFSDAEIQQALEAIAGHRPPTVILERFFASTPRGTALINRLKADPALSGVEIRVLAHDSEYSRVLTRKAAAAPDDGPGEPGGPPARSAERQPLRDGSTAVVDNRPVRVVDLSGEGAQVISETVLRPNQRVRFSVAFATDALRVPATIVWAVFEMSKETGRPHYRAGLEFTGSDRALADAFSARWTRTAG